MVSRLGETRPVSSRLSIAPEIVARRATSARVRFWLSRRRRAVRPRSSAGLSLRSAGRRSAARDAGGSRSTGSGGTLPPRSEGMPRRAVRFAGLRLMRCLAHYANSVAPQLKVVLIFAHRTRWPYEILAPSPMPHRLIRFGLSRKHPEPRMFRRHESLKAAYDAVIIGGGGHGLAAAYYLARDHGICNVAVIEK